MIVSSKTIPVLRLLALLASAPVLAQVLSAPDARAAAPPAFQPARFSVTVRGSGPDVILIPGAASSAHVWDAEAVKLEGRYRLHIVQVAGFAGAPAGPNASGPVLQPTVDELARYIEANHLPHPAIIGHSLGGLMGLMLALQHPADVGRLMIVDSLPWYGVLLAGPAAKSAALEPQAKMLRDQMASETQEAYAASEPLAMARLVKSSGPEAKAAMEAASASDHVVVGQAAYDDLMTDLRDQIAGVKAPVTLLYPWDAGMGAPQSFVDRLYTAAFAALPGVKIKRVDGSFHFIMIDQPQAFADEVEAFLGPAG